MNLLSALLYWIAVALWSTVLITVIINYIRNPRAFGSTRLLLAVVVIDTVRNIVENVYFGSYWGGQFGLFPEEAVGFLGNPILMMAPKALNIVAGGFVLGLLVLRWLPLFLRERADTDRRLATAEREAMGFAAVMDRTSVPVLILDAQLPTRPVVFANQAYLEGAGKRAEEMLGRAWLCDEAADPTGPAVAELFAAITEKRHTVVTLTVREAGGGTHTGRVSVTPIADGAGNVTLLTAMCEGIVEAVADTSGTGEHAGERERLVGRLAGSVAHDFNNLLSVMLSSLETARHMLSPHSPAVPAVDLTFKAARRSSRLARRLMDYSLNRATKHEEVDLAELIENLQPLLARAVAGGVRLELDFTGDPILCRLDAGRLEDALINLCLNARDASQRGGVVRLSTDVEGVDPPRAVITVADTGHGMTPEILARVRERNFTTKPTGNGLGLSSVDEFVKAAGGEMVIESVPGAGTKVHLKLPLKRPLSAAA